MDKPIAFMVCAALAVTLLSLAVAKPGYGLTMEMTPRHIPVNILYHGTQVTITGTAAAGSEVAVKISSPAADAPFKYIGKAGGVFWMKKGDIDFKNAPGLYLLYTTAELAKILSPAELSRYRLGYQPLKAGIELDGQLPDSNQDGWLEEFLRFKKQQRLYNVAEGAAKMKAGAAGNEFLLEIPWPYEAAPGLYTVEVFEINNGQIKDSAETTLSVARAGMVDTLAGTAFGRPAVYGIIAIGIALTAGFAVGTVFKKGGSH